MLKHPGHWSTFLERIDMETVSEEWRQVKDYEGLYEVSNLGNIKSLARTVQRSHGIPRRVRERLLQQSTLPNGYRVASMYSGGVGVQHYVHQVVAAAFIGERPHGMEVNHKDTNKLNNSVTNLEYMTHADNMTHAKKSGLVGRVGEQHVAATSTEKQIRDGYAMVAAGARYKEAAAKVGLQEETLASACRGVNWKCLNLKPLRKV